MACLPATRTLERFFSPAKKAGKTRKDSTVHRARDMMADFRLTRKQGQVEAGRANDEKDKQNIQKVMKRTLLSF